MKNINGFLGLPDFIAVSKGRDFSPCCCPFFLKNKTAYTRQLTQTLSARAQGKA
jgi:hypothetical protein